MIFVKRQGSYVRLLIHVMGAFLSVASTCQADTIFNISIDTSGLAGNPGGPYALDFQLSSGDTTSEIFNNVTLSLFTFGAGGSAGIGNPFPNSGNASGDLGSGVTLSTASASFFNEFSQYIAPGSLLTFRLDLTNTPQSSGTPDEFAFQLIDNTLSGIYTTDPSGSNALVVIDLTGRTLTPGIFATIGGGVTIRPQVSPSLTDTPEPATVLLLAPPLFAMLWFARNRLRNAASSPCVNRRGVCINGDVKQPDIGCRDPSISVHSRSILEDAPNL